MIVSSLISLMKDQHGKLDEAGIEGAPVLSKKKTHVILHLLKRMAVGDEARYSRLG